MQNTAPAHPLAHIPPLNFTYEHQKECTLNFSIPDDAQCFALWDMYEMPDNIRAHSLLVAQMATELAKRAVECGFNICVPSVRASALLHDIAKSYTIRHGGSHAQMGASFVIHATGNRYIAQGVATHVQWPWRLPEKICALPFFIIYADKRVMHDTCVTLDARYEDLLERYGKLEKHRILIKNAYEQGKAIEQALSQELKWDLHAYTLDSGRLVLRT